MHLYFWKEGSWGTCSATCGGGTQTHTVACTRDDDIPVADSYCSDVPKPAISRACGTLACGYKITNYTTAGYRGCQTTNL